VGLSARSEASQLAAGTARLPGVAGLGDKGRQVERDQVGDQQQQPGLGRVHPVRPGGELQHRGAGQPGVAARDGYRGGDLLGRPVQQPAEAFLGISATLVRLSGVPSPASRVEIS
jgi:hypothetical protein